MAYIKEDYPVCLGSGVETAILKSPILEPYEIAFATDKSIILICDSAKWMSGFSLKQLIIDENGQLLFDDNYEPIWV